MNRVLIIDDNASDFAMLSIVLGERSPSIILDHASDGQKAMDRLYAITTGMGGLYDLIVLDLNLPLVHGLDILRFAKQKAPLHSIPIFVFTTFGDGVYRSQSLALRPHGYLIKPCNFQGFQEIGDVLMDSLLFSAERRRRIRNRPSDPLPRAFRVNPPTAIPHPLPSGRGRGYQASQR
jgi:two-component system chemotaxis response regulator CheY